MKYVEFKLSVHHKLLIRRHTDVMRLNITHIPCDIDATSMSEQEQGNTIQSALG